MHVKGEAASSTQALDPLHYGCSQSVCCGKCCWFEHFTRLNMKSFMPLLPILEHYSSTHLYTGSLGCYDLCNKSYSSRRSFTHQHQVKSQSNTVARTASLTPPSLLWPLTACEGAFNSSKLTKHSRVSSCSAAGFVNIVNTDEAATSTRVKFTPRLTRLK